jgi:ADP-heptose:LPS heptosyltransferase
MGDVIMTTPAVSLLKRHFPDAALSYLVEEPFRRLVEGNPHLARVIIVPERQGFGDFLRLIRDIRRERYDILLDFHGGPRATWITLLSGACLKVGYAIRPNGFPYDLKVSRQGKHGPIHSVENHANLVRALGVRFEREEIPALELPDARREESERVKNIMAMAGINLKPQPGAREKTNVVVVHIGAGNRFRDWGKKNIADLVGRLAASPRIKVILTGTPSDQKAEREILAAAEPDRILSLVGKLNLAEVRELISRAALFVGPDSGPMHLAAATRTPVVALFGPTLPAVFGPWRPDPELSARTVILEKSMDCRPCPQRDCVTGDFRCLQTISPGDVFGACLPFLEPGKVI